MLQLRNIAKCQPVVKIFKQNMSVEIYRDITTLRFYKILICEITKDELEMLGWQDLMEFKAAKERK